MGLISQLFGGGLSQVGDTVTDIAQTFRPHATRQMELGHEAFNASLNQHSAEFANSSSQLFDRTVNGLTRLPRPFLALGTLGLFVYAMVDPERFSIRMQGLDYVPEPLWWLLGAIVSFYFGARELHYVRGRARRASPRAHVPSVPPKTQTPSANPALEAWRARRGG